jgi:hypothetical protein
MGAGGSWGLVDGSDFFLDIYDDDFPFKEPMERSAFSFRPTGITLFCSSVGEGGCELFNLSKNPREGFRLAA